MTAPWEDAYTEPFPTEIRPPVRACCPSWMDGLHTDGCEHASAVRGIDLAQDPTEWHDELPAEVGEPVEHDVDGEELGGDYDRGD